MTSEQVELMARLCKMILSWPEPQPKEGESIEQTHTEQPKLSTIQPTITTQEGEIRDEYHD